MMSGAEGARSLTLPHKMPPRAALAVRVLNPGPFCAYKTTERLSGVRRTNPLKWRGIFRSCWADSCVEAESPTALVCIQPGRELIWLSDA